VVAAGLPQRLRRARDLAWQPPYSFRITWHPGSAPDRATEVEVVFEPVADGTLVTLEHSGWEQHDIARHTEYGEGWPVVLGHYAALAVRSRA
jgi:uncharacterized protein YndB with AHSA1/START domain